MKRIDRTPARCHQRDVAVGPHELLRVRLRLDPAGMRVELGTWRASPGDRSADRFHLTGQPVVVPVRVWQQFQEAVQIVGAAALEAEFWRPLPDGPEAA